MTDRFDPRIEEQPPQTRTVLFFSDNGVGLGHLTRLMAVANQANERFQPVFLTMSLGYQLLREAGIPSEFFPAYHQLGLSRAEWLPLLSGRMSQAIAQAGARVVVVDHVLPPSTFRELHTRFPDVLFVWSSRGLWRAGKNKGAPAISEAFDVIVEPGDLAAPIDNGASASRWSDVLSIRPVVLVQPDEYLTRDEARKALGIPQDGRAILINLNDSSSEPLSALIEHVSQTIRSAAKDEDIHLFAPLHPLLGDSLDVGHDVIQASVYPLAACFKAFDGAVSNAGYNSFHELVVSGLPAVFVPHAGTNVDDQERRARFADLSGRAFWAPKVRSEHFRRAVERMLRPGEGEISSATAEEFGAMTGAAEFADFLAERAVDLGDQAPEFDQASSPRENPGETPIIRSGRNLHDTTVSPSEPVLLSAIEYQAQELEGLAVEVARLQAAQPSLTPVFMIKGSPQALVGHGFAFESVMTEPEWSLMRVDIDYSGYLLRRVQSMLSRYGTDHLVEVTPGRSIESQMPRAITNR